MRCAGMERGQPRGQAAVCHTTVIEKKTTMALATRHPQRSAQAQEDDSDSHGSASLAVHALAQKKQLL